MVTLRFGAFVAVDIFRADIAQGTGHVIWCHLRK